MNILNKNNEFYDSNIGLVFQSLFMNLMLTPYYKLFFNMKVLGKENIPREHSVIFASNHCSYHDPPLLAAASYMHIAYMAKKELFDIPVLSSLIKALGAFPVNREKLEISTIKTAKYILKSRRWHLGIFPQGTRIMDGTIGDIKPGFGYLAVASKATVIPVFIDMKRGRFPFYGKLLVTFGKPLPMTKDVDEMCENWKKAVSKLAGYEYIEKNPQENQEMTSI